MTLACLLLVALVRFAALATPLPPTQGSSKQSSHSPEYTASSHHLVLCDHPPHEFQSKFLGSPTASCKRGDTIKSIEDSMYEICLTFYSVIYSESFFISLYDGWLNIFTNEKFVSICRPICERYEECEEHGEVTVCPEAGMAFFLPEHCHQPSQAFFMADFLLDNNSACFKAFCEGRLSVVDTEVAGMAVRLTNNLNPNCSSYLTESLTHLVTHNQTLYVTSNVHWPCCYPMFLVIWVGNPKDQGLNGSWSYLPTSCQAGEVALMVLMAFVVLSGMIGNLIVVLTMLASEHKGQDSSMLRTSLAMSDLLQSMLVSAPALWCHLRPFFLETQYVVVTPDMTLTGDPENATGKITVQSFQDTSKGFLLFQSLVFSICSIVSLLMLLLLSVERFIITRKAMHYQDYFIPARTKLAIFISWFTGCVNALIFTAHHEGHLSARTLTFAKLPTGTSGQVPDNLLAVIHYHGQIIILLMAGVSTATFSLLAIHSFLCKQAKLMAEWRKMNMQSSWKQVEENRYILLTMVLMVMLFLFTTLPLTVNIVFQSTDYIFFPHHYLFSFLSWWFFQLGAACNPWLYNFRSNQFRADMYKLWRRHTKSDTCSHSCNKLEKIE